MRTDGNQPASTISIRAYLAGLAMQGICANSFYSQGVNQPGISVYAELEALSRMSVKYADALIAELNKDDQDGLPKDDQA